MRDDSLEEKIMTVTLQNMKTTKHILTATLGGIALFALISQVMASDIAASPRLQQQLNDQQKPFTVAVVASDAQSMSCPKCADRYVTRFDPSIRGAVKYTTVVQHGCSGCQTTMTAEGVGKAKQQVSTHTCSDATPCCGGMKKASN